MLRWLNVLGFAGTVAVNTLANVLPIAGVKTEDVSLKYQNLFTPADFTFVIWGPVYALLAGFVWYQAKDENGELTRKCGPWFFISSVLNALWMILWHYELLGWSVACMLGIVIALTVLSRRLLEEKETWQEKVFVQGGIGLYYGWILIAAVANAAAFLVQTGVTPFGVSQQACTMAIMVLTALLAIAILQRFGNILFGVAIVWGFIGVIAQHLTEYRGQFMFSGAAGITAALMVIVQLVLMRIEGEKRRALE